MIIKTKILKPTKKNIHETVKRLKLGETVALPTETVYGLAGRCDYDSTIKNIFKIKKRPSDNPLIVHYGNIKNALNDIRSDSRAVKLAHQFFSGLIWTFGTSN